MWPGRCGPRYSSARSRIRLAAIRWYSSRVAGFAVIVPAAACFWPPPHAESAASATAEVLPGAQTVLGLAAHRVGAAAHAHLHLLHPDVDAASSSRRLLQRSRHQPAHGAAMLSVLLGTAFVSRQCGAAIPIGSAACDTMLAGSACQVVGLTAFS